MASTLQELQGRWLLVEVGSVPIAVQGAAEGPHFSLNGKSISGFDGCNRFSSNLDAPEQIVIGQRACAGKILEFPLNLTNPLQHLTRGTIEGQRLLLPAQGRHPASVFRKQ